MNKPLKPKQLNAIQLLATGTPAYQVAEKLEITTMTLYRWQKLPEFNSKLNYLANSGLEEIAKKMNATTITAIETLQETLCDMSQPTSLRIKAALGVLGVTSSINGMLEKALKHRVADFDLQQRWDNGSSFDMNGNPCEPCCPSYKTNAIDDKVITI
ncbi:putative insertion element HTH domain-containing protein [Nitrosomonas oligotropha]|uniref:Putative insertion element HTH domain-containing protein n=1 Tax=Nitrosomonas oligotropha TaxID=42354 RepID=A0A2T5H0E1_9PROT|nr:phBC6A51 family helix-turn-helix protein [Nitrosomonas oligotropha]PTQ65045.1 putative insertion element HTH domain-containing protein [Nitrosomonas oligotropha]